MRSSLCAGKARPEGVQPDISQVKRKCGLDVGQDYNLSKKEDAKGCLVPMEKEAAIMDALKHFQMI